MKTKKLLILNNDFIFLLRFSRMFCLAPVRCVVHHNTNMIYISGPLQIISILGAYIPQLLGIYCISVIIASNNLDVKKTIVGSINIGLVVAYISYAVFYNETRIKTYMMVHTKINKVKRNLRNHATNSTNYRVVMLIIIFLAGNYLLMIFDELVNLKTLGYRTCMFMLQLTISNVLQLQSLYIALSINSALNIIKAGLQKELSKMIADGKQNQYCYFPRSSRNIQLESINQAIDTIGLINQILPNINNTTRQKLAQRISLINDSFVMTCDALGDLNNSDNILLFLQLVTYTFSIVLQWHAIVSLNEDDSMWFVKSLIQYTWFIFQTIKIMIIIEPYYIAQKQIKKIRLLVAEMICHITSESDPVIQEIKAFVEQLLLKDIPYSAFGICNLGRPVISGSLRNQDQLQKAFKLIYKGNPTREVAQSVGLPFSTGQEILDIKKYYNKSALYTLSDNKKVWSRPNTTKKDGSVIKFRIQDLPWEQHKDDIVAYSMKYYIKDEIFHKAAGIFNNEESKKEYQEDIVPFYDSIQPHVSICCLDDDSNTNDILGMSILQELNSQSEDFDSKDYEPKTKEMQNFFHILCVTNDIKEPKGYETYYDGRGICVRPDYRGMGIANEFGRLRKQICIDYNIQMSCAWMTSIGTQKAANKYNWKTSQEIPVAELERKTGLPFNADTPIFKLMYITKE